METVWVFSGLKRKKTQHARKGLKIHKQKSAQPSVSRTCLIETFSQTNKSWNNTEIQFLGFSLTTE